MTVRVNLLDQDYVEMGIQIDITTLGNLD